MLASHTIDESNFLDYSHRTSTVDLWIYNCGSVDIDVKLDATLVCYLSLESVVIRPFRLQKATLNLNLNFLVSNNRQCCY